jgi:hypothetical protein
VATTAPASAPSNADADFSLVEDRLHRAQQALGLIPRKGGFGLGRRITLAIALTWLPLVAWAYWQRKLLPGNVPEPLLQHFGVHARFLVSLPLLLVTEATVQAALRRVLPQFLSRGLVDDAMRPAFRKILDRGAALRSSKVALAAMLALVFGWAVVGFGESEHMHEMAWTHQAGAQGADFGILWFSFVSRPLYTLVLLAWLWRIVVLSITFGRISRLDLKLAPTHPDRTGGLGFLEQLPIGMAPLFFAVAVPIAGRWGHEALYHGMDVHTLRVPAAVFVLVQLALGLAPLLVFAPKLRALRRRNVALFGALLAEHGRLVERRWIRREQLEDDALLGAPEIGPVADTVCLFETVSGIRSAPVSRRSLLPIALASVLPLVPVFATQMPLKEIASMLLAPLVGI